MAVVNSVMIIPACIVMVATALLFLPVLSTVFNLERAIPINGANLSHLIQRDHARHQRILHESKQGGVITYQLKGTFGITVGLYYTKIQIGTPATDFYVQVDTGSDVTWVGCSFCSNCPLMTKIPNISSLHLYNSKSSSTSSSMSCFDRACPTGVHASGSNCSADNHLCSYSIYYGDKSVASGYYVLDLLNYDSVVGSSQTVKSTIPFLFGCSTVENGFQTLSQVDGILGLGHQGISMISQLASQGVSPYAFSHCLRGEGDGGGILVLGEIVEPNMVYSPLIPFQPHYNLDLQIISLNGQPLPINPSSFSTPSNEGAVVDSGTTLVYLPSEPYHQFISALNQVISTKAQQFQNLEGYLCYQIVASVRDVFPPVALIFNGGAELALGPEDYLLNYSTSGSSVWCLGFQKNDGVDLPTVLGDIVLKNRIFVYDLVGKRIGWTSYDCDAAVNVSTIAGRTKPKRSSAVPIHFVSPIILVLLLSIHSLVWLQI